MKHVFAAVLFTFTISISAQSLEEMGAHNANWVSILEPGMTEAQAIMPEELWYPYMIGYTDPNDPEGKFIHGSEPYEIEDYDDGMKIIWYFTASELSEDVIYFQDCTPIIL